MKNQQKMRRGVAGILLAGILLTACGSTVEEAVDGAKEPTPQGTTVPTGTAEFDENAAKAVLLAAKPSYPTTSTEAALSEAYMKGLTAFTDQITGEVLATLEGNACFSPVSLYFPLAMTAIGAKGETLAELSALLGTEALDEATVLAETQKLFQRLYRDVETENATEPKLLLANSLWLNERVAFDQSFLEKGTTYLYQTLFQTDFTNPATPELMSAWISDNTNGLLKPQIELSNPELVLLYLINTLYFKAAWRDTFHEGANSSEDFTRADGSLVTAEYMNRGQRTQSYRVEEDYTGYSLYLQGAEDLRVTFLLPAKGLTPRELLANYGIEALLSDVHSENSRMVNCKLPKFDFSTKIPLNEAVQALGVTAAFDPNRADFLGMIAPTETDLVPYISQILQETKISIDEDGIEGAAYTMIEMMSSSSMPEPVVALDFFLDRPFLFAVHTEDGIVLFAGVIDDPTA